jgi:glycosyltransferase involved in cell wall biosynthesis
MGTTAAVLYLKDGYDTSGNKLLGRQAAGEGFLKALVRHGTAERLYCCAHNREEFADFCNRIDPWAKQRPRQVRWLPFEDPRVLAEPGALYKPDPLIGELAWQRRFFDQRAYSLCGVTHTIASKGVLQAIGDLLVAPVQPWDALICTSTAVKTTVERLLGTWAEYLAQRIAGGTPALPKAAPKQALMLPVIPLGVDCDAFPQGQQAKDTRSRLRQKLGIPEGDIAVLFVGRLIFSAKAHPVPMYLALERAAQLTGAKVHLIQAGWFEDSRDEQDFTNTPKVFCPSVRAIFVDGRQPEIRSGIWHAADIFISLSDNIQETFGLTPIEAMAAGVPAIVSDWDGYQESVRHEIDGFKIPTLTPPPASALDLVWSYVGDSLNYSTYIGHAAMVTAVDVDACARALATLISNDGLRQRMGENGRTRAREVYDWKVVIAAYEQLWAELATLRASAPESTPVAAGAPPYPLCDDPFRLFAHYPTAQLTGEMALGLGPMAAPASLNQLRSIWIANFGSGKRVPAATLDRILATIATEGPLSVGEIVSRFAGSDAAAVASLSRSLVYLIKFDILRLQ